MSQTYFPKSASCSVVLVPFWAHLFETLGLGWGKLWANGPREPAAEKPIPSDLDLQTKRVCKDTTKSRLATGWRLLTMAAASSKLLKPKPDDWC
eukprot:1890911-Amphidinium_carterae.1